MASILIHISGRRENDGGKRWPKLVGKSFQISVDLTNGIIAQASLNLTPEERKAYGQLFQQADGDGLGVVTGDVAVKFFEKTKLDSSVLGEVSRRITRSEASETA